MLCYNNALIAVTAIEPLSYSIGNKQSQPKLWICCWFCCCYIGCYNSLNHFIDHHRCCWPSTQREMKKTTVPMSLQQWVDNLLCLCLFNKMFEWWMTVVKGRWKWFVRFKPMQKWKFNCKISIPKVEYGMTRTQFILLQHFTWSLLLNRSGV